MKRLSSQVNLQDSIKSNCTILTNSNCSKHLAEGILQNKKLTYRKCCKWHPRTKMQELNLLVMEYLIPEQKTLTILKMNCEVMQKDYQNYVRIASRIFELFRNSMRRRLYSCISARGGHLLHLLQVSFLFCKLCFIKRFTKVCVFIFETIL